MPDRVLGALTGANFAHLATLRRDGSPHNSTMWVSTDGTNVFFNTAEGRAKLANMRHDPRVSVSLYDDESPYQPITIQGEVIDISTEGADAHIDELASTYLGVDAYPYRSPGEVRVKVTVRPTSIIS